MAGASAGGDAHGGPAEARVRACGTRRRLPRPDRPAVASWGIAPAGQARSLGEAAGPERGAETVVPARAETVRGVSPALHRGAPQRASPTHRPPAPGARGDTHARLLRPRHEAQRRRRPRGDPATWPTHRSKLHEWHEP